MEDIPLSTLTIALVVCVILSGLFSGSETGLMSLNRYRLKHLAKAKHTGAMHAHRLLQRPDRLIGLILLGNNFVNILASSLATIIGLRLLGEAGVALAAIALTVVILIFSEVTPKTLAALHPERIAFPAAIVYTLLLKLFLPFVWVINLVANSLLRLIRVDPAAAATHSLTQEELRTVVNEAGALIPKRHQAMLLSIMDLEKVTIEDIMVPRTEIIGIDLNDNLDDIAKQLGTSLYTRLPTYRDSIDEVTGILHVRKSQYLLRQEEFSHEQLQATLTEPYFVPEGTPLHTQLLNFQRHKERIAMVVDEYGDIKGLVTLEDILEEIVGEFTTDPSATIDDVVAQKDGSYIVDCSANIRELNRSMGWDLPTDGPKTLNGLILEYMETIPEAGTSLLLSGYPIEIMQTRGYLVRKIRIYPDQRKATAQSPD